jgi:HEAT repeat protein
LYRGTSFTITIFFHIVYGRRGARKKSMSIEAVKAIMSIYNSHPNLRKQVLEALGQAGGDDAAKAIVSIYNAHPNLRNEILRELGQAGGNEAVKAIISIYNGHPNLRMQVLEALGHAGKGN